MVSFVPSSSTAAKAYRIDSFPLFSVLLYSFFWTWSAGILTLNYVKIPGYDAGEKIDPTFIASVFTGVLATFGVEAGQKKKNAASGGGANISKKDKIFITHFQVTLSVFIATDCFMWGCPQNHQATIQGRQRQKASQTP